MRRTMPINDVLARPFLPASPACTGVGLDLIWTNSLSWNGVGVIVMVLAI